MTAQQTADRLYALLDSLRACLCSQLSGPEDAPAAVQVCMCALLPRRTGDCACSTAGKAGEAWVRLVSLYPSKVFPQQSQDPGNCGAFLAAGIEVGVLRPVPTVDSRGRAPGEVELANAARLQVSDAMSMWAAYSCCTEVTNRPYVLGAYTPTDAGDCAGGIWPATVHLLRVPGTS